MLVEILNVMVVVEKVGISLSGVYKICKDDFVFVCVWEVVLCVGYDSLEMEVLSWLCSGDVGEGKKFDNVVVIWLFGFYCVNVVWVWVLCENEDEQVVFDLIDVMIDEMCNCVVVNVVIIVEDDIVQMVEGDIVEMVEDG